MLRFTLALAAVIGFAALTDAAPPDVPAEIKATPGQLVRVTVKTDKKIGTAKNFKDEEAFFGELVAPPGQKQYVFQPPVSGAKSSYVLTFWTEGELEGATCTITLQGVVPPTPPVPPEPKPPEPKPPGPVTSFHVIFVYETSQQLTAGMQQVMFGEKVRTYLDSKTTRGAAGNGWRRFDADVSVANERDASIKGMWTAARPKVTTIPCVMIEVNGTVEIVDFPAGEDAALALLKKYGG